MKRTARDLLVSLSLANLIFWRDWRNLFTNSDDGGTEALYLGLRQTTAAYFGLPVFVLALALIFWLLWSAARTRPCPRAIRRAGTVVHLGLTLISPFAAVTLGRSLYMGLTPPKLAPAVSRGTGPALHRTLVILFDEMDEGLLFADREKGFKLEALDRFRAESVSASLAFAPQGCTLLSVPASLTGETVLDARAISDSDLALKLSDKREHPLSTLGHLFSDARALGSRTAVIGYFHPYCRLFGPWLDDCRFHSSLEYAYGEFPFRPLTFQAPWRDREALAHRRNMKSLVRETEGIAARNDLDLIFIHVPLPRPPGVAEPFFGKYSEIAYLGNAEVADVWFAALRKQMEKAGLWDQTAIVVTSDHGYRDHARAREPLGPSRRFTNVPLMVKLPGPPQKGETVADPLSTLALRTWVIALLKGEIPDGRVLKQRLSESRVPSAVLQSSVNEYCKLPK